MLLLLVLDFGLAADLVSKTIAFDRVGTYPCHIDRAVVLADPDWQPEPHPPVMVLPWNILDLQLVVNRGAVFGIGTNKRFFFIAFTLAALATGLFVFGKFTSSQHHLAHFAIGLILAGGIGNLYDRIVFGVVRDFLHMFPGYHLPFNWRWPGGSPELFPWVFNLADMMLLSGMAMLMLHINMVERQRRRMMAAAHAQPNLEPAEPVAVTAPVLEAATAPAPVPHPSDQTA